MRRAVAELLTRRKDAVDPMRNSLTVVWSFFVEYRNATAAVIGAGDDIGAAIVKKFAAEGFTACDAHECASRMRDAQDHVEFRIIPRTSAPTQD